MRCRFVIFDPDAEFVVTEDRLYLSSSDLALFGKKIAGRSESDISARQL